MEHLSSRPGDCERYRTPSILTNDLGRHLMQTVLSMLLLVTAIAVAFFDARDLFIGWYSITEPELATNQRLAIVGELVLCSLLIVVILTRYVLRS
jgi:hypothetical protein